MSEVTVEDSVLQAVTADSKLNVNIVEIDQMQAELAQTEI